MAESDEASEELSHVGGLVGWDQVGIGGGEVVGDRLTCLSSRAEGMRRW